MIGYQWGAEPPSEKKLIREAGEKWRKSLRGSEEQKAVETKLDELGYGSMLF